MFESQYYCLVAGLKELTLDAENKGFEPKSIINEILDELSPRDAKGVKLLYTYYDCENLAAARAGRQRHNPLGNLDREQIEAELEEPSLTPPSIAKVIRAFASSESQEAEDIDITTSFERALFEAYYRECASSSSRFLKEWSEIDRNLRNISAAITARLTDTAIDQVVVGEGEIADSLRRSSAADFGLRGELPYIDTLITAINDEPNIVEKEHKIDNIRWAEVEEASTFDYFTISAVMAYLVKLNIVARWAELDPTRGREMLKRLMQELSANDKINNKI
ncbi:MAG: DUF2764 family protein [Rikenellaceae bacterium]